MTLIVASTSEQAISSHQTCLSTFAGISYMQLGRDNQVLTQGKI